MLYVLLALLLIGIDQISKLYILNSFDLYQSIPLINNYLHITYIRNYGAAFGILQNFQLLFIIVTTIVIIIMLYYFIISNKESVFLKTAIILIVSGGIGNLIDRIRFGYVVDFIDVKLSNIVRLLNSDFPVFNIADSLVVVGTMLLIYYIIFKYDQEVKQSEK